MEEKNEKLEALLSSLRERNISVEDLKRNSQNSTVEEDEEEDVELLDNDSDDDIIYDSYDDSQSTIVDLKENDKDVDLGDFF